MKTSTAEAGIGCKMKFDRTLVAEHLLYINIRKLPHGYSFSYVQIFSK
jgi:hypothetical protein